MELTIKKVKYSQISTENGRSLRLAERPGIYAWYRELDLRKYCGDKKKFIGKVENLLNANLSDTFHSKAGVLYNIVLTERAGSLTPKKREWLEAFCDHETGRQVLSEIFLTISELQSPLYIGKAINVRDRISDHINNQSELIERFQKASIELDDCFVKIIYLDQDIIEQVAESIPENGLDSLVLLVEDLITRLGPAAFVRRPG